MSEPTIQRKNSRWAWLSPAAKAMAIGGAVAALTLLIIAFSRQSWMGYTHEVYQEFATAKPQDGLRDSVGFRGELPFFWEEILASKAFGLRVMEKCGRTPYSYTYTPQAYACSWVESDSTRKQGLFLVIRYPYQGFRVEGPASVYVPEFRAVAEAFVEAAKARGVDVAPVGEILVGSLDDNTWRSFVRNWWLRITLACCSASLMAAWLFGGFSRRNACTAVSGAGGGPGWQWKKWAQASVVWWGRKPVFFGFGVGVGTVLLVGAGAFWVHRSDYRQYRAYLDDKERVSGAVDLMASLSEAEIRKMHEQMNRMAALPNFTAANARSSFAMELYVRRHDESAVQQMCAWSLAELIAKVDDGLKEGGLFAQHELFWQRRQVVDRFLEEHPELRVCVEKLASSRDAEQPKEPDPNPAAK